ncbi:hypothetical protein ACA910_017663 [Epithemia clementina (nom. ined.)]
MQPDFTSSTTNKNEGTILSQERDVSSSRIVGRDMSRPNTVTSSSSTEEWDPWGGIADQDVLELDDPTNEPAGDATRNTLGSSRYSLETNLSSSSYRSNIEVKDSENENVDDDQKRPAQARQNYEDPTSLDTSRKLEEEESPLVEKDDDHESNDFRLCRDDELDLQDSEIVLLSQCFEVCLENDDDDDDDDDPGVNQTELLERPSAKTMDRKLKPAPSTMATLTQLWGHQQQENGPQPLVERSNSYSKIGDDCWYLHCNKRSYKLGETFHCLRGGKDLYVAIDKVDVGKDMHLYGACKTVCIALKDTFLGPEHANNLQKDPRWLRINKCPDKVLLHHDEDFSVRLIDLKCRVSLPHKPSYVYQYNRRQEKHAAGFDVSFTLLSEHPETNHNRRRRHQGEIRVLDMFAGAGGVSLGFRKAGLTPMFAVDNNPEAIATLGLNQLALHGEPAAAHNNPMHIALFEEDMASYLQNCENQTMGYPQPGKVDHVHASPPCQGFSRANRTGGKNDVHHNNQSLTFVKAIKFCKPQTASLENVTGMLGQQHISYPRTIFRDLLLQGYQVRLAVAKAKDYGDPQGREGVWIFAATPDAKLPQLPKRIAKERHENQTNGCPRRLDGH